MKTRDEYVSKLKARLDHWNSEATRWESQAKATNVKQLETFRQRRDEALYNLKLVQDASATAWKDLTSGADKAWDEVQDAFTKARTHFEKTARPKSGA